MLYKNFGLQARNILTNLSPNRARRTTLVPSIPSHGIPTKLVIQSTLYHVHVSP